VLILFATLIFVAGAFFPARFGWSWLAAFALMVSGGVLCLEINSADVFTAVFSDAPSYGLFSGPVVIDLFSLATRGLVLIVGIVLVLINARSAAESQEPEVMGSLLLILSGLNLLAMSNDLVIAFLGLELVSIPTYVLLFIGSGHVERYAAQRQEAATKYFFLSILSSGILLYGFSFLYGIAGSTNLQDIFTALSSSNPSLGTKLFSQLALVLIFAGLAFRLTAVPFHFYAPDVYQGTTNPNAGLLAVVPKFAGLLALIRIVMVGMPGLEKMGWQLTLAVAIVTMTLGNLLALWQNNIRRLLAYSSIAHAGYMLIGLSVSFAVAGGAESPSMIDGIGATIFYLLVYSAATAGAFAAITYLGGAKRQVDTVEDLAGLSQTNPITAAAVAICMFSLTGLPPLAGFWGKFGLLTGALSVDSTSGSLTTGLWPWFLMLSIVAVINAAISAGYYLRIIAVMYFRPSLAAPTCQGGAGAAGALFLCTAVVVLTGLFPGALQETATDMSRSARESFSHQLAVQADREVEEAKLAKAESNASTQK
jgi:NADH-quinone oxidoreductase subunit N